MEQKKRKINDAEAYRAISGVFKKRRKGMTVADMVAKTALPIETVRGLINDVADEYSARISVSESGEILYSFPSGFTSRYRGFRVLAGRALGKIGRALAMIGTGLFKAWIMIMLVGYFVLFMLIALAALVLSAAASNSSNSNNRRNNSGGGLVFVSGIFDFIIRIWFYSELTKSLDRRRYGVYGRPEPRPKGKPLYKAIFSFVFGDGDPNAAIETRERQAVIAYIQANKGLISLPEFMILTGTGGNEADSLVSAYCSEYGGMPEATEDGTVVYRFDALLLQADRAGPSPGGFSTPLKLPEKFSQNKTKMNIWFCIINSVNLIFGSYFFVNAMNSGHILTERHFSAASFLYARTYVMTGHFIANPLPFISIGLGVVPLVFSLFFWLIPLARYALLKKNNEKIKLENLRKNAFMFIWDNPSAVKPGDINPAQKECRPKNMDTARERVIKDMCQYSVPDVSVNEAGETVYSFNELKREKDALAKCRSGVGPGSSELGKIIFRA
ncbi:MAG: hypothetical protein LBD86_04510 [Spirochaetaceae bacterium]|jgi:hypothetical protein|nr:hypothetical protein [Spirochaetaceae bacterium]